MNPVLPFIIIILSIILSRIFSSMGYRELTQQQQVEIINKLSKFRSVNLIPLAILIVILISYLLNPNSDVINNIFWTFLFLIPIYHLVVNIAIYKKMLTLNLPKKFVNSTIIGNAISFIGLVTALFLIFIGR